MTDPDTIVARSTPPGRGAVALVRLSGTRALAVLEALSPGVRKSVEPRAASLCTLHDPDSGDLLDRALVLWFPGPASYTGEDVVEISTHGGSLVPASVLDACVRAGAREALAGEFTQRAYLNGKLDLIQAEAIHDLIDGRSRAAGRAALHQLEGGLSARIAEVRDGIVELEALLVHHLDFPEEDDAPVPVDRLAERGRRLVERLEQLRRTAPGGLLLREGALVVLAGPPNAGKSSLFNALVGQERAIVTEVPGTTRDAIEVPLSIGGFPFRLVDTAGLRDEPERVERLGIKVAHRYLAQARIVLYCEPVWQEGADGEAFVGRVGAERVIRLTTRADEGPGGDGLRVSVVTGEGLAELKDELAARAFRGLDADAIEGGVVTRERQLAGIERAIDEIGAFCSALDAGVPVELASTHLRPAETALEGLLGIVDPDEVLDRVFREFCVGK